MNNEEHLHEIIACNIKGERKKLCLSQSELAERANISIDTVKSVESGRRIMSLDTYLRIVQALETTPSALLYETRGKDCMERFAYMMIQRSQQEMEFALYMLEKILKGHDNYLKG